MVNYHSNFRSLLLEATDNEIPVYYEYFTEKAAVPCISYMEADNHTTEKGDTLRYSSISFLVKIWAEDIATIQTIASNIDNKLQTNGFINTSSNDSVSDNLLVKYMRYKATGYENGLE